MRLVEPSAHRRPAVNCDSWGVHFDILVLRFWLQAETESAGAAAAAGAEHKSKRPPARLGQTGHTGPGHRMRMSEDWEKVSEDGPQKERKWWTSTATTCSARE